MLTGTIATYTIAAMLFVCFGYGLRRIYLNFRSGGGGCCGSSDGCSSCAGCSGGAGAAAKKEFTAKGK